MSNDKNNRRITGKVISDKGDKSIVVMVTRSIKHPVIGKYIKKNSKIHAHDESNKAKIGDEVIIEECRPMSKLKSWVLVQIADENRLGEN